MPVLKILPLGVTLSLSLSLWGCKDLTGSQSLPAGTPDPTSYNNATGAIQMRNAAVFSFGVLLPSYIINTALLTDELTDPSTLYRSTGLSLANHGQVLDPLDERVLPELPYNSSLNGNGYASDNSYTSLQSVRMSLLQAIGQLATYDVSAKDTAILKPGVDSVLRGELYALYGYTDILLADFFCSGIPLSTLDFHKDFTYRAGSTTTQVYQDAIGKLDTALALASDSVRIQNLARIGLGRAYLDAGNYLAATDDVSTVPIEYTYTISEFFGCLSNGSPEPCLANNNQNIINAKGIVVNREGGIGLPYLSSGDPRTADTADTVIYPLPNITVTYCGDEEQFCTSTDVVGYPKLYSNALNGTGYAPVTIASGVEAYLIRAEGALRGGDPSSWLTLLNQLRSTAPIPGTTQPAAMSNLGDPGTDSARIALMFQERAAWLYMTGHRQGDLRRQLRQFPQYWFNQSQVYPSGTYLGLGGPTYGADVTAPIPSNEYLNPLFHGCLSRAP